MLLMRRRSTVGQGVLLASPKWTRHPLKIEEDTTSFLVPGTRALIEMLVADLNHLPHATFISYFPLVCLVLVPLIVFLAPFLTVYVFKNTWILSVGVPCLLLVAAVVYCVCYSRYKSRYNKVVHYHQIRLAHYYSLSFP